MFIKKVTNRKAGKIYITFRLVKSKRVNGVPKHITILELGSLLNIPNNKHKAMVHRLEQLISNQLDILSGSGIDDQVEEYAQYFFRKLIKKQLEFAHIENKKPGIKIWICCCILFNLLYS